MKADLDDFRRVYAGLNDESLLAVNRDELVPLAQQCYDAEIAARGLDAPVEADDVPAEAPRSPGKDLVEVASFRDPSEAGAARFLLRTAEIPCFLSTDFPLQGSVLNVAADVRLYVPPAFVAQTHEILDAEISDEELAAQSEAAALEMEEEEQEEAEEDDAERE